MLRAEPAVFGPVASDPTVSLLIALAAAGPKALHAIRAARAEAREHVWDLAKDAAPDATGQVIVDLGRALVLAHSEKQGAIATWKKCLGHHPLMAFVDTEAVAAGSRWPACSGRATQTATPPPIKSPRPSRSPPSNYDTVNAYGPRTA